MPQGTIQSATPGNRWTGRHGQFLDYTVQLDNGGPFIISRKLQGDDSHKAVEVGSVLHYEIKEQGDHGTKIKEINPEYAGQSNGGDTAPKAGVILGGRSDARQDSIERQVAAKCAAEIVAAGVANGKLAASDAGPSFDKLTNEFHKTIRGFTVEEPAPDPKQNIAAESLPPADKDGLKGGAQMTGDDDSIPFAPSRI